MNISLLHVHVKRLRMGVILLLRIFPSAKYLYFLCFKITFLWFLPFYPEKFLLPFFSHLKSRLQCSAKSSVIWETEWRLNSYRNYVTLDTIAIKFIAAQILLGNINDIKYPFQLTTELWQHLHTWLLITKAYNIIFYLDQIDDDCVKQKLLSAAEIRLISLLSTVTFCVLTSHSTRQSHLQCWFFSLNYTQRQYNR